MNMRKPIPIRLHGIIKDVEESELASDKWSDGRNVHFQHNQARRTPGEDRFAETGRLFPADVVQFVDNGVTQFWVYAAATPGNPVGIAATDGLVHYNLTPAGWPAISSTKSVLTIGIINGLCWINHPEFGPFYWDNDVTHDMVKLPGWPVGLSCRVMRAHKEFLMAMCCDDPALGLIEGQVRWSSSAGYGIPQFWVPAPTNDAGDKIFSEVNGPLIEGISVRDQFFVCKPSFTGVLQYVGGQFVFASRDIFPSVGCMATGAATEAGNIVYMLTGDMQFVKHDGTTYQNILYGQMQDYFREVLNAQYPTSILVYRDDQYGQVMLAYPTGTNKTCNEAISVEVATGDCGIRDLSNISHVGRGPTGVVQVGWDTAVGSWDTDPEIWNQDASGYAADSIVFAGGTAGMLEQGAADSFVGGAVESHLSRSGITLDEWGRRKTMSGCQVLLEANQADVFHFQFGAQDTIDGPTDLTPSLPYVMGAQRRIDFFMDGRLLYVGLAVSGGAPWKFGGVMLEVRGSGA